MTRPYAKLGSLHADLTPPNDHTVAPSYCIEDDCQICSQKILGEIAKLQNQIATPKKPQTNVPGFSKLPSMVSHCLLQCYSRKSRLFLKNQKIFEKHFFLLFNFHPTAKPVTEDHFSDISGLPSKQFFMQRTKRFFSGMF